MGKQNSRHKARTAARHSGKRQKPSVAEHNAMEHTAKLGWATQVSNRNAYDPDNDGDNDSAAQDADTPGYSA